MTLRHGYREQPTAFVAERTSVNALGKNPAAWAALAHRSADINPFYHPEYLLAAAELQGKDIECIAVYANGARDSAMLGFFPLMRARMAEGALLPATEFFRNDYICLTTPLVDVGAAETVWESFLDCVAHTAGTPKLVLSRLSPLDCPTFAALQCVLSRRSLAHRTFETYERAFLNKTDRFQSVFSQIAPKRRRDLQRRRRRMRIDGHASIELLRGDQITPEAIEMFLNVEASGWKGKSGTALQSHAATRRFAERFLSSGDAELAVLRFNGQPIAIDANLVTRGTIHTVKTAYDEAFSSYAPGLTLGIHTIRRLVDNGDLQRADSCAVAGHVLEDIWPDRLRMGQLAFAAGATVTAERLDQIVTLSTSFKRLRTWLRTIVRG